MRVVLVCPYALDQPGGVQNQVVGLARALRGFGHDIAVIAPGSLQEVDQPAFTFFGVGAPVSVPVNGSRAPVCIGPLAARRTKAALRVFKPSVVHIHEPFVPAPALSATRFHFAPSIATFHRAGVGKAYRALRPVFRPLMKRLDIVVAVSDEAYATMKDVIGGSAPTSFVIGNGVDVSRFSEAEPRPAEGVVVVFAGRHESRKGLGVALEAFCRSAIDASFWVIGTGPQTDALRSRYSGDARISWCGQVSDEELASRMKRADVFVAPSLGGESFGVVLLEAMAAHTAVIASDIPGYRLAARDAARYVPPGEIESLERALEELATEPAQRAELADRGVSRARELDFSAIAAQYDEQYRRLTRL